MFTCGIASIQLRVLIGNHLNWHARVDMVNLHNSFLMELIFTMKPSS